MKVMSTHTILSGIERQKDCIESLLNDFKAHHNKYTEEIEQLFRSYSEKYVRGDEFMEMDFLNYYCCDKFLS